MKSHKARLTYPVAGVLILAALVSCASTLEPDSSSIPNSPEPADAAESAEAVEESESWYPRTIRNEKGEAVIYAPQIEAWEKFETLTAWIAFSVSRHDSDNAYYGTMRFSGKTDTDIEAREVLIHDFEIHELTINGLDDDSDEIALFRSGFTALTRKVPLDLVFEYLPQSIPLDNTDGLNVEPPTIFHATEAAIFLRTDGEPIFIPIPDNEVQFLINTPWDVLREGDDGAAFLCYEGSWLTSPSLDGTWTWADSLPTSFASLPDTPSWNSVRDCLPADLSAIAVPDAAEPKVFYATVESELLLTDGEPEWAAIGDVGLEYATNTKQELFRYENNVYVLLSGRWFAAPDFDGPWTYAATLPDAFQGIPSLTGDDPHAKSYVRSSIPGTQEAWEAALIATIPRKAEIQRGSEVALKLDVTYAGEPVFEPIEDLGIDLALNTSYQVLRYEDVYYLCHRATWLFSSSPTGPWKFADSIPEQFSNIPPSSPAYNTTFVSIDGSNDDMVNYSYTGGYENAYVSDDTVKYGTGHPEVTYSFHYGYYSGYPYNYYYWGYPYYWYPPTYGYGSWYDPRSGRYGEAVVAYGPYGAAGAANFYNPQTGVYGRGEAVWDSNEFAGRGYAYNPNTNTSLATNRYMNYDDNSGWSERVARRGDEWRYTQSEWDDGRMTTDFQSSRGTEGSVTRERNGNTVTSEGTVSRGNQQAEFESTRQRVGDGMVTEGSITGENRSAEYRGSVNDGNYTGTLQGSEGGTATANRQLNNGEITGGTTVSRDGQTVTTDVNRTAEGVQRDVQTSGGGQGTSYRAGDNSAWQYETGGGDVYAGRDGNVYQRTNDGWQQVENPRSQSSDRSQRYSTTGTPSWSNEMQRDSSTRGSRDSSRYDSRQLNRDHQSRQRGYDRYSQQRSSGARRSGARRGGGRRRR